jgi:hypothetical protein
MSKPKGMSRAEVRSNSKSSLHQMRSVGIDHVELLGSGTVGWDCAACLALKGKRLPISEVTPLPLPECDLEFCKCLYIAVP